MSLHLSLVYLYPDAGFLHSAVNLFISFMAEMSSEVTPLLWWLVSFNHHSRTSSCLIVKWTRHLSHVSCVVPAEKETGGRLAPSTRGGMATSRAIMWPLLTPSRLKSKALFPLLITTLLHLQRLHQGTNNTRRIWSDSSWAGLYVSAFSWQVVLW